MASSSGSLETTANSRPASFSFSTQFSTSFSDLLKGAAEDDPEDRQQLLPPTSRGLPDRSGAPGAGMAGLPKFKSLPPPSLPIYPPLASPSSYFAIPAGLSPAELLDSPVLISSSNLLASPTTGTFPSQSFNWKMNSVGYLQGVKEEDRSYPDFSFQTRQAQGNTSASVFQNSSGRTSMDDAFEGLRRQQQQQQQQQQTWNYQEAGNRAPDFPTLKANIKTELAPSNQNSSLEVSSMSGNTQGNNNGPYQPDYNNHHSQGLQRKSDDGYNWRKYGQKQVKGSENPRSYYKCTFPNCPTKKKVERNLEGQITEIVYKGQHNHPKPQSTRRNSLSQLGQPPAHAEASEQSFGGRVGTPIDSAATPENSSASFGDDDFDNMSSQRSRSGGGDETVREPKVVVQTTSDIDILDDGYRWRKYGQKVVKGNPNPRSYYKCTSVGCPVRKHVERASHDLRAVITTYEGKHNHEVPPARGSGAQVARPAPVENPNVSMAIRPSATATHASHIASNSLFGGRPPHAGDGRAPFTLEMLQQPERSYGFPGFDNPAGASYVGQPQHAAGDMFAKAKDESKDDKFLDSLLY
ncbi:hypothetical protein Taro_034544 [Colocasia esculenta]|uniref:WRKY domain-containing protein n=1 Tax=Colocasia esculenta TaxID=4460 RepID=A0A843W4B1_COLES|nr:hypothetical protein [Colocasia esculenta]